MANNYKKYNIGLTFWLRWQVCIEPTLSGAWTVSSKFLYMADFLKIRFINGTGEGA